MRLSQAQYSGRELLQQEESTYELFEWSNCSRHARILSLSPPKSKGLVFKPKAGQDRPKQSNCPSSALSREHQADARTCIWSGRFKRRSMKGAVTSCGKASVRDGSDNVKRKNVLQNDGMA